MTASGVSAERGRGYGHMGAVLCDAGLQDAVNYRTVVVPRIDRLLSHWPCAHTPTAFQRKALRYALGEVLRWHNHAKLDRIYAMTALFSDHCIDTCHDAQHWLTSPTAEMRLLDIHGVGVKTIDYLRILVGIPGLTVDRHIEHSPSAPERLAATEQSSASSRELHPIAGSRSTTWTNSSGETPPAAGTAQTHRTSVSCAKRAVVARAVDKRRREFATVRHCARRALATLGQPPVPLLPGRRALRCGPRASLAA